MAGGIHRKGARRPTGYGERGRLLQSHPPVEQDIDVFFYGHGREYREVWIDAMLGSYHINPDPNTHFEQFNPGLGVECWLNNQWALTAGGFRNSLRRPSYYGGGVWAPEFAHWGIVRIAAIGGIISGYNYGNWGLGHDHTIGPVVAPIVMVEYKRVGANFIVIPPIPSDNLPFTIGFQLKVKF